MSGFTNASWLVLIYSSSPSCKENAAKKRSLREVEEGTRYVLVLHHHLVAVLLSLQREWILKDELDIRFPGVSDDHCGDVDYTQLA